MELALPYGAYRLTRADGARVERLDKHPFCMSRVYYDATEKPEEVRGSCGVAAFCVPEIRHLSNVRQKHWQRPGSVCSCGLPVASGREALQPHESSSNLAYNIHANLAVFTEVKVTQLPDAPRCGQRWQMAAAAGARQGLRSRSLRCGCRQRSRRRTSLSILTRTTFEAREAMSPTLIPDMMTAANACLSTARCAGVIF